MFIEQTYETPTSLGTYHGRGFAISGVPFGISSHSAEHRCELVIRWKADISDYDAISSRRTIDGNMSLTYVSMRKIEAILNKISQLKDDWDGYGAIPISEAAINNVKAIGKALFNWDFSKWQISPSVNGDIYINYKGKDKLAGFLIGDELFTYFVEENGQLSGQENHVFDPRVVVNLMRNIAN